MGLGLHAFAGRRADAKPAAADGAALGDRLQTIIMQGVALCVIYIGITGSLKGENTLVTIISMVVGALIGEVLELERRMLALGDWVQAKVSRVIKPRPGAPGISEGFVTASLLFCVGAMAIVGSLENGLTGNYDTLKAKSVLDGISAIVFSASLGIGVSLFRRGDISLPGVYLPGCGAAVSAFLSDAVIAEMTCVGSLLIFALGLNMLGLTKIKVMNLVPGIFLPIVLMLFM